MSDLEKLLDLYKPAPSLEEMPGRSLSDKGIDGPTGAHVIEEIHTPFNLAYITVTTGSTAFQNIVGVTHDEIPDRIKASHKTLSAMGIKAGERMLITYAPLVNVFPGKALEEYGITWFFPKRPGRDGLLLALTEEKPDCVLGESTFLRSGLVDAGRLGLLSEIPKGLKIVAAGTPLDPELPELASRCLESPVHDLYGCQEFGWLTLDGIPLRRDISLVPETEEGYCHVVVGGIPTGDSFPLSDTGHILNRRGKLITYGRKRTSREWETVVLAASAERETLERTVKTILRIKGKIIRLAEDVRSGSSETILQLNRPGMEPYRIKGPHKTVLFDTMVEAQKNYQANSKTDPSWIKER